MVEWLSGHLLGQPAPVPLGLFPAVPLRGIRKNQASMPGAVGVAFPAHLEKIAETALASAFLTGTRNSKAGSVWVDQMISAHPAQGLIYSQTRDLGSAVPTGPRLFLPLCFDQCNWLA